MALYPIKIEKGVPIPKRSATRQKYKWDDMEIGDSFLFTENVSPESCYSIANAASKTRAPKKFSTRKTSEGMRCWRIK